jgi:hypothetical protein
MSDLLLEWMSFRRSGDVDDIPEELLERSRTDRLAEDLATLGHLEITTRTSWQIAPPVLAGLPRDMGGEARGVLCGARTAGLLAKLEKACRETGVEMESAPQEKRPSVVLVRAATESDLMNLGARAGLPFQRDAAFTLLACLPTLAAWPRTPCPMVSGRVDIVRRFSRSKLTWIESSLRDATRAKAGLFRIKRDWDSITILKSSEMDCARIDDRAGRLMLAAKRRVARWDSKTRTLSLPLHLYPPIIIARAFTLCSGGLPTLRDRRVHFGGVTPGVLGVSLASLGLRLE